MNSIDSKIHSCKNPIPPTSHHPLQIRTNKHRCFVFCIGHTSLTCVPGIGKKNKRLLNRSGIDDLSMLYSKYRSINNIQQFKQWLQEGIGFTSYQAKMTTCGIGSKLGEIKEINTGLTPICCPSKGRRGGKHQLLLNDPSIRSKTNRKKKREVIKTDKVQKIKSEDLTAGFDEDHTDLKHLNVKASNSPISNSTDNRIDAKETMNAREKNQLFNSSKTDIMNKLSDDYLTGGRSPHGQILAKKPLSKKHTDESDSIPDFDQSTLDHEHAASANTELLALKSQNDDLSLQNKCVSSLRSEKNSFSQNLSKFNLSSDAVGSTQTSDNPNNIHDMHTSTTSSDTSPGLKNSKDPQSSHFLNQQGENEIRIRKSPINDDFTLQGTHSRPLSESFPKNKTKQKDSRTDTNVASKYSTLLSGSDGIVSNRAHQSTSPHSSEKTTSGDRLDRKDLSKGVFDHLTPSRYSENSPANKSWISLASENTTELNSGSGKRVNERFPRLVEKSETGTEALQNKTVGLNVTSKTSPSSSSSHEYSQKSILRDTQSKKIPQLEASAILTSINRRQPPSPDRPSEKNLRNTAVNSSLDSNIKPTFNEGLLDKFNDKSITAIKRSYASMPLSTPAVSDSRLHTAMQQRAQVFPTKSKSRKESDVSNSLENTMTSPIDQHTPVDSKPNTDNSTAPASMTNLFTERENIKQHDISISNSVSDGKKFHNEERKLVNDIIDRAEPMVHAGLQSPQTHSVLSNEGLMKNDNIKSQSDLRMPVIEDSRSIFSSTVLTPINSSHIVQHDLSNTQLETPKNSFRITDQRSNNDGLHQRESKSIWKSAAPIDNSSPTNGSQHDLSSKANSTVSNEDKFRTESMSSDIKHSTLSAKKSSIENYAPVIAFSSDSKQSTTTLNALMKNMQSHSSNINRLGKNSKMEVDRESQKLTEMIVAADSSTQSDHSQLHNLSHKDPFEVTSPIGDQTSALITKPPLNWKSDSSSSIPISTSSMTQFSTKQSKQRSLVDTTHPSDKTNERADTLLTSSDHLNQVPVWQNTGDKQIIRSQDPSETVNLEDKFEEKHRRLNDARLETVFDSTPSKRQPSASPSSPVACNALWDNISNENIFSRRKKDRLTFLHRNQLNRKNPNDLNQNSQSCIPFFTFVTRAQHSREQQALEEHILYIKRTKSHCE